MLKKTAIGLIIVLVVLAGIGFYFTPYLTYRNIRAAADNKDTAALSEYIDFPSIRKSLKDNFKAKIEITEKKDGDKTSGMAAAIASAFINPLVDAFVTPETIGMLLKGNMPSLSKKERRKDAKEDDREKKEKRDSGSPEIMTYYDSFNRFVVEVRKKGSGEGPIALVFKRSRLLYWKLYAIQLP